jgi:hypothetical protein
MLILTTAARDLIARAFDTRGDTNERQIWSRWSAEHQHVRRGPNDPLDDGTPDDHEFAAAAGHVLERLFVETSERAKANLSEDDVEDLDNELAYIRSVMRSIGGRRARAA